MKKLLFLLLLVGCEKEDTFCWKCRRDVFTPGGNYSVVIEVCDLSEAEAHRFELSNTLISGSTTINMSCWKVGNPAKIK